MPTPISSETVFSGRVFKVARDRVKLPHGPEATIDVVRHSASAVLVPMPDPDHVILIRQYRYPVDQWLWELPAGTLDEGETPETAASRECHEEIGLVPDRIERLGAFFPTPGYCDEEMFIFKLTGLSKPAHEAAQDPDEDLEPKTVTVQEAREMVRRAEIVDMKTAIALTLI